MLKETVTYTDFNGYEQTEDLYFNLSRTEMVDMLDIRPRIETWRAKVSGEGDMSDTNIREMLDLLKILVKNAYGERSEDGKHFRKSPEIYADFEQSAVYDSFIFSMFATPERLSNFMIGILPQSLLDTPEMVEAQKEAAAVLAPLPEAEVQADEVPIPAWIQEDRDPTDAEVKNMGPAELRLAFQRKQRRAAE